MARAMFQLHIKPDHLDAYRSAHASVSRDMLEALHDSGWRNYSIFLADDGTVTGYFEADDIDEVQRRVARTDANARWQAAMADHFVSVETPGDAPVHFLTEIFHLDDQLSDPSRTES